MKIIQEQKGIFHLQFHSANPISIIYSLARELRNISRKIGNMKE